MKFEFLSYSFVIHCLRLAFKVGGESLSPLTLFQSSGLLLYLYLFVCLIIMRVAHFVLLSVPWILIYLFHKI